jgi:hypothetical protein
MSIDDLLIAIIIAGAGLAGTYLRAELVLHRRLTALQRRMESEQYEFHAKRVGLEQNDVSRRARTMCLLQANGFRVLRGLAHALRIYTQERKWE